MASRTMTMTRMRGVGAIRIRSKIRIFLGVGWVALGVDFCFLCWHVAWAFAASRSLPGDGGRSETQFIYLF